MSQRKPEKMFMSSREDVLQQALALSAEDRAYVVIALEHSLEPEADAADEFIKELHRRSAAYRSGETTARPADEVLAELRQRQNSEAAP